MTYEQLQMLIEKVQRVQHTLSGVLLSMGLAAEVLETLEILERNQYERYWREMHLKAIQDLHQSLAFFDPIPTDQQPSDEIQEQLLQAIQTAFSPEEVVNTLRTAWELAHQRQSAPDMLASILPTLAYTLAQPMQGSMGEASNLVAKAVTALYGQHNNQAS